jgi:DNA gyrase subunit A
MKLAKLTKLDKDDLVKELEEKKLIIADCTRIINEEVYRNNKLIDKISDLKNKYGDARRTELLNIEVPKEEKEIAEVVPTDVVVVTTESGLIKKVPVSNFKVQHRNTKGIKTNDDVVMSAIKTNTVDYILAFSNSGRMYRTIVDNIPDGNNTTKGVPISSLIQLSDDKEKIIAVTSLHRQKLPQYVIFITKQGMLKKSYLSEYLNTKRNAGIAALKLREGDSVASVIFQDDEDMIILTKLGMGIRFETKNIGAIGRNALGVIGIKLNENDEVLAGLPIHKDTDNIGIFTEDGMGKKIKIDELPKQARGGKGILLSKKPLAGTAMISDEDNILISSISKSICISAKEVPLLSKAAEGNIMIKNKILSIAKM